MKNLLKTICTGAMTILIFAPLMPKIGFSSEIVIYPYEIVLAFLFVCVFFLDFHSLFRTAVQRWYLAFIGMIAISTWITSFSSGIDAGSIMRLLKLLIYVCVPAIIFHLDERRDWMPLIARVGTAALALNMYFVIIGGSEIFSGKLAFDIDEISGGLSGKYFSLTSFSLQSTGRLSHGVWATYVALQLATVSSLYFQEKISKFFFALSLFFISLNIVSSISREGLLIVILIMGGYCFSGASKSISIKPFAIRLWPLFSLGAVFIIAMLAASQTQMGQKISFMFEFLSSGGVDGNISGRFNTWMLSLRLIFSSYHYMFFGVGYNLELYGSEIEKLAIHMDNGVYSTIPESLLFTALVFSGFFGVFLLFCLIASVSAVFRRAPLFQAEKVFYAMFLIGLLITNFIAGATAISDLILLNIFILVGFWYKKMYLSQR
ncbi:hypothetical protein [Janthinobacterium sp. RB2R34]|uniref:hypothetical protein n=1 Tax=Janthinobacterium sp. RB2R34 TaxID=3424193 RepID=UPI003F24D4F2